MNAIDIVVIAVVSVAFVAAVGWLIYKKIKGKGSGCGCGCEGCPHCNSCKNK